MSKLSLETGDYAKLKLKQERVISRFSIEYLLQEGCFRLEFDNVNGELSSDYWEEFLRSDIFGHPGLPVLSNPRIKEVVKAATQGTMESNLFQSAIIIANRIDLPGLDGDQAVTRANAVFASLNGNIPDPRGKKDLFVIPKNFSDGIPRESEEKLIRLNQLGRFRIQYAQEGVSGFYYPDSIDGNYKVGVPPSFATDEAKTNLQRDRTYDILKEIQKMAASGGASR